MKRTLSLVLALVMVLGTFTSVFAAPVNTEMEEAGALLEELGVLVGSEEKGLMLNEALRRRDAVVMLSRLMGEEDDAKIFPGAEKLEYNDIENADPYYLPFLAWAQANGTFKGHEGFEGSRFGYEENITIQQYLNVVLRVLGYEVEYAKVMETAVEVGLVEEGLDNVTTLTRGGMALISKTALETEIKDTGVTLAEKLNIEMPAPPAPATFELEGVTATNLREVDVEFNKAVDEDSLAKANFLLGTTAATSVALLEDGMTVRAMFEMEQQTEYTLTIKTVKDVDGLEIKDETKKFVAFDNTAPLVQSVEVFGNKKVVVTFTEPVNDTAKSLANYKIDGKLFGAMVKVSGRKVHLELASRLSDGVHTFAVDSKVTDFAGFKVIANSNEIVVAKDDTKPEVASVDEVTQTKVVVTFTEPVEDKFSVSAVVGTYVDKSTTDNLTYTLNFSGTYLPLSGTEITLKDVTDYYGNKDTIKINVVPTIDLVRPEVKGVTAPEQNKIVVEFTKAVALNGTYTLKTVATSPVEIAVTPAYATNKAGNNITTKVVLTSGGNFNPGDYTLEIKGVKDLTPLENTVVPVIQNVTVADLTKPELKSPAARYIQGNTENQGQLYIYFNEKVDVDSALNKANYSYVTGTGSVGLLGDSNSISLLVDGKTVKITLPKGATQPTISSLTVANVKDLAGNVMIPAYTTDIVTSGIVSPVVLSSPKATALDKIVISVTNNINPYTVTPSDFMVRTIDENHTIAVIDTAYNANNNTITLTLNNDLTEKAEYQEKQVNVVVIAKNLEDIYGNKVYFPAGATEVVLSGAVADKIVPTLDKVVTGESANQIKFIFSEELGNLDISKLVVKKGGKVVTVTTGVYGVTYTQDANNLNVYVIQFGNGLDLSGETISVSFPAIIDGDITDTASPANSLYPTTEEFKVKVK